MSLSNAFCTCYLLLAHPALCNLFTVFAHHLPAKLLAIFGNCDQYLALVVIQSSLPLNTCKKSEVKSLCMRVMYNVKFVAGNICFISS